MTIPESDSSALTEECRVGLSGDFVEHTHRDFGAGYFCTADVLAKVNALDAINAELLEALKLARDYVRAALIDRQAALAGWPEKYRIEEADLATVDAAIKKATA